MILFTDVNFLLPDKTRRLSFPKEKKKSHPLNIPFSSRTVWFSAKTVLCAVKWRSVKNCIVTREWAEALLKVKTMFSLGFHSKYCCVKTNKQKGFLTTKMDWDNFCLSNNPLVCSGDVYCTYLVSDIRNIYRLHHFHRFPASHDSARESWGTSSQSKETMAPYTSQPLLIVSAYFTSGNDWKVKDFSVSFLAFT